MFNKKKATATVELTMLQVRYIYDLLYRRKCEKALAWDRDSGPEEGPEERVNGQLRVMIGSTGGIVDRQNWDGLFYGAAIIEDEV